MQRISMLCYKVPVSSSSSLRSLPVRQFRVYAVAQNGFAKRWCRVRSVHSGNDKKHGEKKGRFPWNRKASRGTQKTYYDVLGVSPTATHDEIRLRYLEMVKLHHPDSGGSGSSHHFTEVSAAWKVLGNKTERMNYDTRLQLDLDPNDDQDDIPESERGVKVILSHKFLKVGPALVPLPRWILVPLIWVGVDQAEGDTPVHRQYYKLGLWWTLCILLGLRQIYVTVRDWHYDGENWSWMTAPADARSRFAWRLIGFSVALATLPLWARRFDFLSKTKGPDPDDRHLDAMLRITPLVLGWLASCTYFSRPILGAGSEFAYSKLNRTEVTWDWAGFDVLEKNCSRILQGVGACATMALCVQRQRIQGVETRMCGKAATVGLVSGRIMGWLFSFALVSNARRQQLRQPRDEGAAGPQADKVAQLQLEVQQLREALERQQAKS